ncbi:unnamed protein product [Allacma fusca]|uniref:Uncharacterized protein n=1 Tax=Allacma fusca TaxID=39272 RepID=A0A8J2LNX2_9HEXA|nr:unnamed protein product [Allacma fusca]
MGKLFFVRAAIIIAMVCLLNLTEAKKHKESKRDKHCKQEGDPANHSFSVNSMCRAENSLLTMDTSSGRKPAKSKDNHIKCECYEPGWQRCKDKSKGKNQQSGPPSNSPSNGQQGITYEENPKCHDGNSENRSKKCHKPVVLLIEEPCRCHEQLWSRCDRSSSSPSTPAPAASSTANAESTNVNGGSTGGGATTDVSGAEAQSSTSESTTAPAG